MVAFNWSHARAGRPETQLELSQAGMELEGTPRKGNKLQTANRSLFYVRWRGDPSLLPSPSPQSEEQQQTTCLFLHCIESFSVMRMTCFQMKMVKRWVFVGGTT